MTVIKIPLKSGNSQEADDSVLPFDLDTEKKVLALAISYKEHVGRLVEMLEYEDFYDKRHATIFKSIQAVNELGQEVDTVILFEYMEKHKLSHDKSDVIYLSKLGGSYNSENMIPWCLRIKEKSMRRRVIKWAWKLASDNFDESRDIFDVLESSQAELGKIAPSFIGASEQDSFQKSIDQVTQARETHKSGGTVGYNTGIASIDKHVIVRSGKLIIIGARTSMGKTAFAIQIAVNLIDKYKMHIGFASAEMPREDLDERIAACVTGISIEKISEGKTNDLEHSAVIDTIAKYAKYFHVISGSRFHIDKIKSEARKMKKKHNIGAFFADYIQRFKGDGETKTLQIGDVCFGLKELTLELEIPIYALSQLNRAVESRANKEPMLIDLKESGDIEQDADVIMFLFREAYYMTEEELESKGIESTHAIVKIAKNRQGRIFVAHTKFFAKQQRWRDADFDQPKLTINNHEPPPF